jgi:hypothetical protein
VTYKTVVGGREYKWVEKGERACLIVDETRLLWWGEPGDPQRAIPIDTAPLEVLLTFSVLRRLDRV